VLVDDSVMPNRSPIHAGNRVLRKLGGVIRAERTNQGFSQEEFAWAAGIDRSYYGAIERGENNVTVLNLLKISEGLGLSVSEIFIRAKL